MPAKALGPKLTLGVASISAIVLAAATWMIFGKSSANGAEITIYKSASCDCCTAWADYLEANGFRVNIQIAPNLAAINVDLGIPADLQSCHTGLVDGYVVEGHVPAADIQRLLAERPNAIGITVPGMPIGSPGMEQGLTREAYNTILFAKDGSQEVWASH